MNGIIFQITSPKTDMMYYGFSYAVTLSDRCRLIEHNYNRYKRGKNFKYSTAFEILEYGDAVFDIVEHYTCDNLSQLRKRVQEYINNASPLCVNTKTIYIIDSIDDASLTPRKKSYERIKRYYRIKHDEHTKIINCECGRSFKKFSMQKHKTSKVHLAYIDNKSSENITTKI